MEIVNNKLVENDIVLLYLKKVNAYTDIKVYKNESNEYFVSYDNTIPSNDGFTLIYEDVLEPSLDLFLIGRTKNNIDQLKAHVLHLLLDECKTKDYDSIESICSYFDSSVEQYRNDCNAFKLWRDNMWSHYYDVIKDATYNKNLIQIFDQGKPILNW